MDYVMTVEFADGGENEAVRTSRAIDEQAASDRAWVYFTNLGRKVESVLVETRREAEDSWGDLGHLDLI